MPFPNPLARLDSHFFKFTWEGFVPKAHKAKASYPSLKDQGYFDIRGEILLSPPFSIDVPS